MFRSLTGAATILIAVSVLGCDGSPTQPGLPGGSLELTVAAHQAQAGGDVTLDLTLTNRGFRSVEVRFPDGCQVDFIVSGPSGPVWNWINHVACTLAEVVVVLGPGESRRYTATWDVRADDGSAVAPGTYTVRGALRGQPLESPAVSFDVR